HQCLRGQSTCLHGLHCVDHAQLIGGYSFHERRYSSVIPALWIISAQRSCSYLTNLVKSATEVGCGSAPCASMRSFTFGSFKIATTSVFSLAMMSAGTPVGANNP